MKCLRSVIVFVDVAFWTTSILLSINYLTLTRNTPKIASNLSYCVLVDLYYGGEGITMNNPPALTCPLCGKLGFTEASLQEHVNSQHAESSVEVVSRTTLVCNLGKLMLITLPKVINYQNFKLLFVNANVSD